LDQTPNLLLPYIMAAQAQKHVTHNEAIRRLDAIVHLSVTDRDLSAPPGVPIEGARYIVAASPTGAWAGHTNHIAAFQDGAWAFYVPLEGWLAWIADEDVLAGWSGSAWAPVTGSINPTPLVGVNATADATNKLAVASDAVLFNHNGTGTQVKLNKAALANTASFLFQTGFSGRAEIGLTGDDSFHFKVSPDGTTFKDAIIIDKTSGAVSMPFTSGSGGSVTNVATGTGLAGGPITSTGTISLANMAAATLKGNSTGATAAPADLTAAQVKTILAVSAGDVTGLGALATVSTVNLSTQATGTLLAAQEPAHTGDVTNAAGSLALTIAANAVTNAKAADMAANTIKGNTTGATADPADLTASQVRTLLNVADGANNYVHPNHSGDVTSTGDGATVITAGAISNAKLATAPASSLKGNSTGAVATPSDLTASQVRTLLNVADGANNYVHPNHSGDVTSVADGATTIASDAVTNAKLANMATATIKGRTSVGTGDPEDLTGAQATTLLDAFIASGASAKKGLVPDPGTTAGATRFLREDAVWAAPPGGGGGGIGSDGSAVIDFGGGSDTATLAIAGQSSIAASSVTNAWIFPKDTLDHSSDEHIIEELDVSAGAPTAGTGFTISARTRNKPLRGQWTVAWSWR
jgi:Protein of unknown function (DUF2793)